MGIVTKLKRYRRSWCLVCWFLLPAVGYLVRNLLSMNQSLEGIAVVQDAQSAVKPGSNTNGHGMKEGANYKVNVHRPVGNSNEDKLDVSDDARRSNNDVRGDGNDARGDRKASKEARRVAKGVKHGRHNSVDDSSQKPPSSVFELVQDVPLHTKLPKVVYYLWCGRNPNFVFANYLSLLSVAKFLRPERIFFLYNKYPETDIHSYNTWLKEFREDYAYIELKELKETEGAEACSDFHSMMNFLHGYLRNGGIFIGTNTILTKPAYHLWDEDYMSHMTDCRRGILVNAPGVWKKPIEHSNQPKGFSCFSLDKANLKDSISTLCMFIYLEATPKDIWHVDSETGRMLNFLMYGVERTPEIKPHSRIVVPNVAHMLWLNAKPVNYLFYLSVLSLLYVVRVDTLYIHGTGEPERQGYWAEVMKESRVKFVRCEKPNMLFGQHTRSPHHMSDLFRAQLMDHYGGIYSDVDAIWTQPLSDELRRYDAGAALDWAHNYLYYPDYINLGVSFGRKGAPFWKLFLKSFKVIKDDVFGYNGLLQPYKVYERHPDTLKIQRNLQVMCFRADCYPAWTSDWKSVNWKNETYAFHWTYPDPTEFTDRETLMKSNSVWGNIGKYVLEKSGK